LKYQQGKEKKEFSVSSIYLGAADNSYFTAIRYTKYMNNTHHFRQLARAKNWKEFEQFANNMNIYSLNVTYADTSGNIGYYMTGRVPKRTKQAQESANYPVNGWDGSCDY